MTFDTVIDANDVGATGKATLAAGKAYGNAKNVDEVQEHGQLHRLMCLALTYLVD